MVATGKAHSSAGLLAFWLLVAGFAVPSLQYCFDDIDVSGCFDLDTDYRGNFLGRPFRNIEKAEHCQVICQLIEKCREFSFNSNTNECRLKTGHSQKDVQPEDGFTSGPQVCPVNGGWSGWVNGTCSVSCGSGTVINERTCSDPPQAGKGSDCEGVSTEEVACTGDEAICPVNGGWGEYVDAECDVTCGAGSFESTRQCDSPAQAGSGQACDGSPTKITECDMGECPLEEPVVELPECALDGQRCPPGGTPTQGSSLNINDCITECRGVIGMSVAEMSPDNGCQCFELVDCNPTQSDAAYQAAYLQLC